MSLLLSKSDQGVVIFHIWKNLKYSIRLLLSFALILTGFALQYQLMNFFPGIILIFAGNLLLLVKGYDNRIKLGKFEHNTEWVQTDLEHLKKVVEINNKMRKWDISAFDITSGLGAMFLILMIGVIILIINIFPIDTNSVSLIIVANIVVLIFPHWFTGVKRVTTAPALVNKITLFQNIVNEFAGELKEDKVTFQMLVKGKDHKLPADVKMKVDVKNHPKDLFGLYGQISLNNVKGQDYPYFYVVLVAKESAKLITNKLGNYILPADIISEFSHQSEAEIMVIRQYTTKTSGYHTDETAVSNIFKAGLKAARKIAE